ncbi:MAG TPA: VOC family protein [Acidobacteriaceae bacterium]|nr:VOC family protein [Acidobacteriaceae bacterium]
MRHLFVALSASLLACGFSTAAHAAPKRPPITGISHISLYTTDAAATSHFFVFTLGAAKAPDPQNAAGQRFYINSTQFAEVLPLPAGKSPAELDHTAYTTTDAKTLRAYLAAHAAKPGKLETASDGSRWFEVRDPEGNVVEFVQNPAQPHPMGNANPIGHHMIHVGFVVHDRSAEDRFYRDVLGFRPYWFGGNKDGEVSWVSQQVPDGTDWLEYMLTPSSRQLSQRSLGVMDHFSIGVVNMAETTAKLKAENRLGSDAGGPKIGRDGKWQLNLYDPDGTRAELMEFNNVEKPCCSPFTASNPTP